MSVCGEIENLEHEIKVKEKEIEALRKEIDRLMGLYPMTESEEEEKKMFESRDFDEHGFSGEDRYVVSPKDVWHGNANIKPMTKKERKRSAEREEINQAWYDGDGAELFE